MSKQYKHNNLSRERALAKQLGFEATSPNCLARNPYLRLTNGNTLVWMAGQLISLVTTKTFFGKDQYLKLWKSNNGNSPYATMTTAQINADGSGKHTEIYYREIFKEAIAVLARSYGCSEKDIVVDHINHIRGDNTDDNLQVATPRQNNQNRSVVKVEKAFYTVDEAMAKIASGEWQVLK